MARIGIQVADALAYANKQGVLHRDIKPSNLLLDMQGTVWITDFGLAKADGDDLTHTGDIIGTIRYMAPERFESVSLPQSDVYSLGITLYELLTLQQAFEAKNRGKLIELVLRERRFGHGNWTRTFPATWKPSFSSAWRKTRKTATRRPTRWRRICAASWPIGRFRLDERHGGSKRGGGLDATPPSRVFWVWLSSCWQASPSHLAWRRCR